MLYTILICEDYCVKASQQHNKAMLELAFANSVPLAVCKCLPVMMAYGVASGEAPGPQVLVLSTSLAAVSTLPARSVAWAWNVSVPAGNDRYSCICNAVYQTWVLGSSSSQNWHSHQLDQTVRRLKMLFATVIGS